MTLARDGLKEMLLSTVILGGLAAGCAYLAMHGSWIWWIPSAILFGLWVFTIAFFRDPHRRIPIDEGVMVSPADGKITEVTRLPSYDGIDGPALKISIFLSVFDVHINRMPCAGRVVKTHYQPGEFLDARHPECGIRNESNTITLEPGDGFGGPVIVRQVAGLIARRIICNVKAGDAVDRGQRLGLIKFGSRTDLIVPDQGGLEPQVRVNDMVRGGSSILLRRS